VTRCFTLLDQRKELTDGVRSPFCAGTGDLADHRVGRGDWNAELHPVAIGDEYMSRAVEWSRNREDEETSSEEGVSGIRYFDLFGK
jgi:hypothetical protein